jgi:hypothetical protein
MAVAQGGGLTAPTSFEMSEGAEDTPTRLLFFPPEGTDTCLNTSLASLLFPAGPGPDSFVPKSPVHAFSPIQASEFSGTSSPATSGPFSLLSGPVFPIPSSSFPSAIACFAYALLSLPPEAVSVSFRRSSGASQNVVVAIKVDSDTKGFSLHRISLKLG